MQISKLFASIAAALAILTIALSLATLSATATHSEVPSDSAPSPTAYFHPSILYFQAGKSSSATTTLTNSSTENLEVGGYSFLGGGPYFMMTTTCPAAPAVLAAGKSCTVTVAVSPNSAKGIFGKLVEYDDSTIGHHEVLLEVR